MRCTVIAGIFSMALALPAVALDVGGVPVPASLVASGSGDSLVLNGAGIRQRFFVDIYVAALYLPHKTANVEEILAERGPRVVNIHFVYKDVPAQRLVDGWVDGFRFNHTAEQFQALEPRLQQLNAVARDLHRDETIRLDLHADGDTDVMLNGQRAVTIPGRDFQRALLKIWLGEKPVDSDLRRAMLGQDD